MNFKAYLQEGIIVPKKISIKTTDIKKLQKQFEQDPIIGYNFHYTEEDQPASAAYLADDEDNINIEVYVKPGMNPKELEALIQHEIIHTIQDDKSGYRMAQELAKEFQARQKINDKIKKVCPTDKNALPKCIKLSQELEKWQAKHSFGSHQEEMTYAYMFVKGRKNDNPKDVMDEAKKWLNSQGAKFTKRMRKYFGMYWAVKGEL